ncbi:MAG: hypothetical protein AB1671_02480 [Thermodesulfobacteriota bacterium]|jgi:hypothetical protein
MSTRQVATEDVAMNGMQYWETPDELMTISLCSEGCVHLRIGRTVVKMTREEFFALADLSSRAGREMRSPEGAMLHRPLTGH